MVICTIYRIYLKNMRSQTYLGKINEYLLLQIFTIFLYDQNIDEIGDDQTTNQCQHLFGPLQLHELHLSHSIADSIADTLFPPILLYSLDYRDFFAKIRDAMSNKLTMNQAFAYIIHLHINEIVIYLSSIRLYFF